MAWFDSVKTPKLKSTKKVSTETPNGLWKKCPQCGEIVQSTRLDDAFQVCPYCDQHFRLGAMDRIRLLLDEDTFKEFDSELRSCDPLKFVDKKSYSERLQNAQEKTGQNDGTVLCTGKIFGDEVVLAVMDFGFLGGSMGVVTGEKIARAFDLAVKKRCPAIVVSCSGGARMQEGLLSLMQMAKTTSSLALLRKNHCPFISVLTDPTTGGVAASFALLGDVNLAEPRALIGFAGPRVIEQSMKQTLPEGFQRSEFLFEKGQIDRIVHRHKLKMEISFFVKMFGPAA